MKNTFVKVLSVVMALMMLVGTFSMIPVAAATCAHTNAHAEVVVEPTCVKNGFTSYHCDDCGEEFIDNITEATGEHTWEDQPATEATCDEPAFTAHKRCSVCFAREDWEITAPKLGHVWTLTTTVAPTCTEKGYTADVCARCGEEGDNENGGKKTYTDDPAHEYVYTVITPANSATCTSGTIRVTCANCDAVDYEIYETNNHNWKDIKGATIDRSKDPFKNVPTVGETCNFKYKNGKYCTICGATKDMVANDKNTHTLTDANFGDGVIDANEVTNEILALSWNGVAFGVGTKTYLAPTCTAKGYQLKYCGVCDKLYVVEIAKLACAVTGDKNSKSTVGPWVNADDVVRSVKDDKFSTSPYHAENLTRTTTCNLCGEAVKVETYTGTAHDYDWTVKEGGKDVQKGTIVTPKTCLVNGYTTYDCEYCDETHKTVEATDVAKGEHTYGNNITGYKKGFNCADKTTYAGAVEYTCTYSNCDTAKGHKKYVDFTSKDQKHTWEKKTQAATCVEDAYYYNECKLCKTIATGDDAPKDKPTAGFDANNHVVTADQTRGIWLDHVTEKTCTTGNVDLYYCECEVKVEVTIEKAAGHNKSGVFADLNHNGKLDNSEKGAAAVAPDCQTKEVKQGKYCTVCNTIVEASVVGNKKADKHTGASELVETVAPTCSAKGYDRIYYSCCKEIFKVNETKEVAANHKYKEVKKVEPSCYATGTKAHFVCEYCGVKFWSKNANDKVAKDSELVIPQHTDGKNPGHKWGDEINVSKFDKVDETCDRDGTKAYKICLNDNCGAWLIDGVAVHDNAGTKDVDERVAARKISAHGTEHMGWQEGQRPTCTEDGWTFKGTYDSVYACEKCDKDTVGKTNHAGTRVTTPINKNGSGKLIDCTKPTYDIVVCTACGDTFFDNYTAAKNSKHTFKQNDKKVDIPDETGIPTCTEAAQDLYCCTACDYEEYRAGAAAKGHAIRFNNVVIKVDFSCGSTDHVDYNGSRCINGCRGRLGREQYFEHNEVEAEYKDSTCTEDGHYAFTYCKDCATVLDGNVKKIPATNHANKEFVEVVDGFNKYSCPDCGEYIYEEVVVTTETKITVSTNKVNAGNIITVTYALTGAEYTFSAETFSVDFSDKLTYVGKESDLEDAFIVDSVNGNQVAVTIVAPNTDKGEGREITTSAEGTVLFTLTFQANETASGSAHVGGQWFTIIPLGDFNGDSIVTADDALAVLNKTLDKDFTYDAKYDVNKDGIVDTEDVIALAKFAASGKTGADFFAMIGELDKLEDTVFAIYDANRINDVNGDGVSNIADAYALIEAVEYVLTFNYATLEDYVTIADLVADLNKYGL